MGAYLRAARPRQWAKNVLVLAAPAAAGVLDDGDALGRTLLAVLAFVLVSAGTYYLNDLADLEADRRHPTKRHRPLAAGEIPQRAVRPVGLALLAAGIVVAFVPGWELGLLVCGYVALMALYTRALKHEPVFDVTVVASGFFLRALGGGLAVDVGISRWFLIVTGFGSLFMVTGKRYAEVVGLAEGRASTRAALDHYTGPFLQQVLTMSGTVTVLAYLLWSFEGPAGRPSDYSALSAIPFVLAILRYWLLVDKGRGGEPEEIVLSDRELQLLGVAWAVFFALGVYA